MSGFPELYATACQRILQEWELTARQQELCLLVAGLSYGCEMLTLSLHRQADLAEALGWDSPALSRVLRSVIDLGVVKLEQCAGERLLSLQLFVQITRPRLTPAMIAARERLREMQQLRDSGRCDSNGQMRMPEIIPAAAEAPRADVLAFRAMLEADLSSPPPQRPPAPTSPPRAPVSPASRLLPALRAEIARLPNPAPQLVQFDRYRPWWHKQASLYPTQLAAAIEAHKARPVPAKTPGGWIKAAMQRELQPLLPI